MKPNPPAALPGDQRLLRELHGLQRSLWLQQVAHASWRGLWIGLVVLMVGEALARLAGLITALTPALSLIPAATVVAWIAWSLISRPGLTRAARTADRRLRLRQQLATALELIHGEPTPFGEAQVARAVVAAAHRRRESPEPVRRWMAGLTACLLASFGAAIMTVAATDWLSSPRLPRFSTSAEEPQGEVIVANEPVQPISPDNQALLDSLKQLTRSASGDEPPSDEQLASTEQVLADKTAASRATQQALSRLANALGQISAGQAAADALQRGDYDGAVADIAELAQNSDQLSAEARRTLSKALLEASRATPESPALSDREQRAGDALRYSSYGPTAQALQNLADSVNRVSQSTLSEEQLSAAWQELHAARQRARKAGPPPDGPPEAARISNDAGEAQAAAGGPTGETDKSAAGRGTTTGGFEPEAKGTRLNVAGVPVEVPLQISAGPSRLAHTPTSDQAQTLQVVSDMAAVSGEAVPNPQARAVRAERNAVPLEMRPVVRDYFGAGTPAR